MVGFFCALFCGMLTLDEHSGRFGLSVHRLVGEKQKYLFNKKDFNELTR